MLADFIPYTSAMTAGTEAMATQAVILRMSMFCLRPT
jgi:hypothetical protein